MRSHIYKSFKSSLCFVLDYYLKNRKISAIIRSNRDYLLANIKLDETLIDSLLSFNGVTEGQSHLLKSLSSNRHKNTELLWAMKYFDVAKFSNFVKCLRQTNQKTVARIIENGGGLQFLLYFIGVNRILDKNIILNYIKFAPRHYIIKSIFLKIIYVLTC